MEYRLARDLKDLNDERSQIQRNKPNVAVSIAASNRKKPRKKKKVNKKSIDDSGFVSDCALSLNIEDDTSLVGIVSTSPLELTPPTADHSGGNQIVNDSLQTAPTAQEDSDIEEKSVTLPATRSKRGASVVQPDLGPKRKYPKRR